MRGSRVERSGSHSRRVRGPTPDAQHIADLVDALGDDERPATTATAPAGIPGRHLLCTHHPAHPLPPIRTPNDA